MSEKRDSRITRALLSVIPVKGDSRAEWIRKLAFLLALTVFLCSGYYLVDEVWLQPRYTQQVTNTLHQLYTGTVTDTEEQIEELPEVEFPEGMDESFAPLYRRNPDVVGWLKFEADGGGTTSDLFNSVIDNPVVQADDNDYYLDRNYLGEKEKAGTLFMDYRNNVADMQNERNTIIYGHNLNSGLMFSKFNLLAYGDVSRAQRLTTVTLDTLYGESVTYKVFAVMLIDADATGDAAFDYIRTEFSTDAAFGAFVEKIRARSLYDFGDVDVNETDSVLTLSTCSNKRKAALSNGRTVIVARRLREGESAEVNTALTVANADVLMPKAWYINKGLDVPEAYAQ